MSKQTSFTSSFSVQDILVRLARVQPGFDVFYGAVAEALSDAEDLTGQQVVAIWDEACEKSLATVDETEFFQQLFPLFAKSLFSNTPQFAELAISVYPVREYVNVVEQPFVVRNVEVGYVVGVDMAAEPEVLTDPKTETTEAEAAVVEPEPFKVGVSDWSSEETEHFLAEAAEDEPVEEALVVETSASNWQDEYKTVIEGLPEPLRSQVLSEGSDEVELPVAETTEPQALKDAVLEIGEPADEEEDVSEDNEVEAKPRRGRGKKKDSAE